MNRLMTLSLKLGLCAGLTLSLCACPGKKRAPRSPSKDAPEGCQRVGQRCTLSEGRSKSATIGVCSPGGPGEGLSCVPQH